MSLYKNLLVLESPSYAQVLKLLNQFSFIKDENLFEISPTPIGAVLILNSDNLENLQAVRKQIETQQGQQSQIFTDVPESVVKAYLSQIEIHISDSLACYESNSLLQAFEFAVTVAKQGYDIYDFRFLRASTYRCLVFSNATDAALSKDNQIISNLNPLVKGLFSN